MTALPAASRVFSSSSRPAMGATSTRRPRPAVRVSAATPKGACLRSEQCKHCPTCELGLRTDFLSQYDVEESAIGQGGFGQVRRCVDKLRGSDFAVKDMAKVRPNQPRADTLDLLGREVSVLQAVSECSVVAGFIECFEDSKGVHLVTELCSGGDLKDYVDCHGALDENTLAVVACEVLLMLRACHSKGILYADVKPANFCLVSPNAFSAEMPTHPFLKAVDFGCSQKIGGRRLRTRAGTLAFMAPEVFMLNFSFKADVWSFGVMLYWLFTARLPYWDNETMESISRVQDVSDAVAKAPIRYDYGPWLDMSAQGLDFMRAVLTRKEDDRLSVDEALQHPWLTRHIEELQVQDLVNAPVAMPVKYVV